MVHRKGGTDCEPGEVADEDGGVVAGDEWDWFATVVSSLVFLAAEPCVDPTPAAVVGGGDDTPKNEAGLVFVTGATDGAMGPVTLAFTRLASKE